MPLCSSVVIRVHAVDFQRCRRRLKQECAADSAAAAPDRCRRSAGRAQIAGKLRAAGADAAALRRPARRSTGGCATLEAKGYVDRAADAPADPLRRPRHAALRHRARVARLLSAEGHLVRLPPAAARARRSGVDDRSDRLPLRARHHRRPRDAGRAPQPGLRPAAHPDVPGRPRGLRAPGPGDGRRHPSAPRARSARSSRIPATTSACSTTCAASAPIRTRRRRCARSRRCAAIPHFAAAERTFATLPGFIGYCHTAADRAWRTPGAAAAYAGAFSARVSPPSP